MIDYEFKKLDAVNSGLTMELYPGKRDYPLNENSIYVTENAFGFVEPLIWKSFGKYSHWGRNSIERDLWLVINSDIRRVAVSLENSTNPEEIFELRFMCDEVRDEYVKTFPQSKLDLLKFMNALTNWISTELTRNSFITVFGI